MKQSSGQGSFLLRGEEQQEKIMDQIANQKNITIRFAEHQARHDVIYAAAASPDDKVYFALCAEVGFAGSFARLMCYDPRTDTIRQVADLEQVIRYGEGDRLRHPHSKIHTAICFTPEGKLLAATHMTAPPVGEDSYHYWHVCNDPERKFTGSHLIIHDPARGTTSDFGVVVPGGGARWMTYNPERDEVYITGFLRCHFHAVNLKTGEVRDYGRIAEHDFLGPCYSPADGCVYTSDSQGNLLRFDPEKGKLETLPVGLPDDYWASYNGRGIFNLLPSRDGKKLYGTTWMTHHIFEYDPCRGKFGTMRDLGILGKETPGHDRYPVNRFFPRMLIVGHDGKLYFGAYNAQGVKRIPPHIFSLDPETLEQEDLGRIEVEGFACLNIVASACCTSDNTLYFGGERQGGSDALSLFIYNRSGVDKRPEEKARRLYGRDVVPPYEGLPADRWEYYAVTPRDNSPFMMRGTLIAQEEGMSGTTPLIPRGCGRIGALVQEPSSHALFGAAYGGTPRLFVYFPVIRYFQPLAEFGNPSEVCRSMVLLPDGKLYFGTFSPDGGAGRLYCLNTAEAGAYFHEREATDRGEFTKYYTLPPHALLAIADCGTPIPDDGIYRMIAHRGKIYGLTFPGGEFFRFDPETGQFRVFPCFKRYIVRRANLSEVLFAYGDTIYFSGRLGYLTAFRTDTEHFEETLLKLPCGAGREYLNTLTAAAPCGDGTFYLGTGADGLLARLDLNAERLIPLGKPGIENRIRALCFNRDGVLWGISGLDADVCHLFRYTPEEGMTDEGILRARMPKTWIVHRADVMLAGSDGEIFIGENDDIAHLLVYLPPVRGKIQYEAYHE